MSVKKKLLIFHPALAPYRINYFNSLNKIYDVTIFFERKNVANQKFDQEFLISQLEPKFKFLNIGFNLFGRNIRFSYLTQLYKVKPNIVFCSEFSLNTFFTIIYKLFFDRNFLIYVVTDDSISDFYNRGTFKLIVFKLALKYITGLIVTSNTVRNEILNTINKNLKIIIFPIIHDEKRYIAKNAETSILTNANNNILKYNLKGKKVILFVGRIAPEKNIDLLLKVFKKMNLSDTFLVIVGGGILENSLKLKYKFNNILFTGRLEGDSIKSWYATSQIFVLPSLKEPFGAVINEALIFGNYVLCSNIAGASCLINNNNGIVFNPTNELELEVKLKNYINQIRPIDVLKTLRASKMEYTFDEKFTEFINMI